MEDLYDLGILRLLGTRRFEAANWGSRAGMGTGPTTAQCFEIPTFHSATSFSITDHLVFTHGPSADSAQNNEQQHCNCRNLFVSSSCSSSIFCFLVEGVVVIAIVVVVVSVSVLVSIIITILLFLLGPNWVDKHFLTTKGVTKGFLELILIPEGC